MDENPYEGMMQDIFVDMDRKVEIIENIISMVTELNKAISEIIKNTSDVNKKALFNNEKTVGYNNWLVQYVSATKGFQNLHKTINGNVISSLNEHLLQMQCITDTFHLKYDVILKNLNDAEDEYKKLYKNYTDACEQLETERDLSKVEEMKRNCSSMEFECQNFCHTLGVRRQEYCRDVERIFTMYENAENIHFSLIDEIVEIIQRAIMELDSFYTEISREGIGVLQTMTDINSREQDNAFRKRESSRYNKVASEGVTIQFNIFEYIPYKEVYANVLKLKTYTLTEDFNSGVDEEFDAKAGEFVDIVQKGKEYHDVILHKNGNRNSIPANILKETDYKRMIYTLNEDFAYKKNTFAKGYYLCAVSESGGQVYCRNPSQEYMIVPKELLTPV